MSNEIIWLIITLLTRSHFLPVSPESHAFCATLQVLQENIFFSIYVLSFTSNVRLYILIHIFFIILSLNEGRNVELINNNIYFNHNNKIMMNTTFRHWNNLRKEQERKIEQWYTIAHKIIVFAKHQKRMETFSFSMRVPLAPHSPSTMPFYAKKKKKEKRNSLKFLLLKHNANACDYRMTRKKENQENLNGKYKRKSL